VLTPQRKDHFEDLKRETGRLEKNILLIAEEREKR
jgi:hypothetical protein